MEEGGKEEFGGPFSENKVEDVKTVLQLLPMDVDAIDKQYVYINCVLNTGVLQWMVPLFLVPFYISIFTLSTLPQVNPQHAEENWCRTIPAASGLCFVYDFANEGVHSYIKLFNMHSIQHITGFLR